MASQGVLPNSQSIEPVLLTLSRRAKTLHCVLVLPQHTALGFILARETVWGATPHKRYISLLFPFHWPEQVTSLSLTFRERRSVTSPESGREDSWTSTGQLHTVSE